MNIIGPVISSFGAQVPASVLRETTGVIVCDVCAIRPTGIPYQPRLIAPARVQSRLLHDDVKRVIRRPSRSQIRVIVRTVQPDPAVRRRHDRLPAVELSEGRLSKLWAALRPPEALDVHHLPNITDRAKAAVVPFARGRYGRPMRADVHDLSSSGVAVVVDRPLEAGTQFRLVIPRGLRRPLQTLCVVRHCRMQGGGFLLGAEYGVSWQEALSTLVGPHAMTTPLAWRAKGRLAA